MSSLAKRRVVTIAVACALAGAGVWGVMRLEVETDITHFLPAADDPRVAEVARQIAGSELNRTITLSLEAGDEALAARAARAMGERLALRDGVAWVRSGPDPELERAFYELYFPRRFGFVAEQPDELRAAFSDEGLRERARALKRQLSAPTGAFVREIATQDPWLLFPGHLSRMQEAMAGALRVHEGAFVSEDGRYGIVLLASDASPFDTASQARLQRAIAEDFAAVNAELGGGLALEQAGVHRIALRSEGDIREDVTRVSIAGTAGVLLFLILTFGSFRFVFLGHVPIAAGVACAAFASALVFERVHGLTLAFGATLVGVAIDYVAHYLNHHVLAPAPGGADGTMRRIWPGLLIGGLTTVAGVAALGWTGYPAIREMALFTSVGVLGALLATRFLVPPWLPDAKKPTRLHLAASRGIARALDGLRARRWLLYALPAVAIATTIAGLSRLDVLDDPRALAAIPEDLIAEDERVRQRVARVDAGRFAIAFGADADEALAVNDRVYRALEEARAAGELGRQRSLHPILWSPALQQENLDAVTAARDLARRTDRAYAAEGFVEGAFEPFAEELEELPPPLRLDDLEDSAIGALVDPFVLPTDEGVAVLTFVHDVRDAAALEARLAAVDDALFWDQQAYIAGAYRDFRERTFELVAVGLLFVILVVAIRYRSARKTIAAVAPAVLAGAASLGIVSLAGVPLTLVHVVTLLLVLSMGVDYGVFMAESDAHEEGPVPTVVSLVVACGSTVLSFGALAFSDHPAMQAIGATTAIGVALSLVLAPAAGAWVGRAADKRPGPEPSRDLPPR